MVSTLKASRRSSGSRSAEPRANAAALRKSVTHAAALGAAIEDPVIRSDVSIR